MTRQDAQNKVKVEKEGVNEGHDGFVIWIDNEGPVKLGQSFNNVQIFIS